MSWHHELRARKPPLSTAMLESGCKKTRFDKKDRLFLHIDMDAFFASVEVRDNPELEGRPVAVGGGGNSNRGVITAANYEARKFGLRAGMTSIEAHRRCPHAVFLKVNGRKYTYLSAQIMTALEEITPDVKPLSVDEASLEITDCMRLYDDPIQVGRAVKFIVRDRFELPCSVGIAPNRLVAKMASGLGKPDGLMFIAHGEAAEVFAPLPVDKMVGIGEATKRALFSLGIMTLGQLANAHDETLKTRFGVIGPVMKKMAAGEWSGRMRQDDEREPGEKSIGNERTFSEAINSLSGLHGKLVGLVEMVCRRARRSGVLGRKLTLKIRYSDFETLTHQSVLPYVTDDEDDLIHHAWRLLGEVLIPEKPVRLLGVSLGTLKDKDTLNPQIDLFRTKRLERCSILNHSLDGLRDRFGEHVVARAMGGRWLHRKEDSRGGEEISRVAGAVRR